MTVNMTPLKIGIITPGFSASEQDWCIPALLNTVRVLAQRHQVHVFTLRYPPDRHTYSVYDATVHALGGESAAGLSRLPLLTRALHQIIAEARRAPFDVLHGLWADEPGFIAVTAGYWLHVPAVVSLMGGELVNRPDIGYGHQLSRAARWMIRRSLGHARRVTVGSSILHQSAHNHIASNRLNLAPLGIDSQLFRPSQSDVLTGDFKLLHVASLEPIKNQGMLLDTLNALRQTVPNVHLHIVGDGRQRNALEKQVNDGQLSSQVTFHGNISHERLPAYYQSADVCLSTSHFESQSMVALEAAACGCTTVGTNVGILPELLPAGYTVQPGDVFGLVQIITRLAHDHPLRGALNQQVYETVLSRYTLDTTVPTWEQLYRYLQVRQDSSVANGTGSSVASGSPGASPVEASSVAIGAGATGACSVTTGSETGPDEADTYHVK